MVFAMSDASLKDHLDAQRAEVAAINASVMAAKRRARSRAAEVAATIQRKLYSERVHNRELLRDAMDALNAILREG